MQTITLIAEDGRTVCDGCEVAETPLARARGLLGRESLSNGSGMLIRPCRAIHTAFLRFPIDAVFLDRDLCVVDVVAELRPWRTAVRRRAHSVLELAAGSAARRGVVKGARLAWGNASGGAA